MLDPSLRRWCERVSAARRHRRGDAETAVVNAWITLPQGFPHVKLQFDRRVGIRNYSRLACHLPFTAFRGPEVHTETHEGCRGSRAPARSAVAWPNAAPADATWPTAGAALEIGRAHV